MHNSHGNGRGPTSESLERRHEQSDLNAKSLATFMAILAVVIVVTGFVAAGLFYMLSVREARSEAPASPLASFEEVPPEPRLQALPSIDLKEMRKRDAAVLSSYGWVSREAGVVRMPIDRAMQLAVDRGFPLWPVTPPADFQAGASVGAPAATGEAAAPAATVPAEPQVQEALPPAVPQPAVPAAPVDAPAPVEPPPVEAPAPAPETSTPPAEPAPAASEGVTQ